MNLTTYILFIWQEMKTKDCLNSDLFQYSDPDPKLGRKKKRHAFTGHCMIQNALSLFQDQQGKFKKKKKKTIYRIKGTNCPWRAKQLKNKGTGKQTY